MGRIKQLTMPQTAKSALMPVGAENPFAEGPLVQSTPGQGHGIFSANCNNLFCGFFKLGKEASMDGIVNRDREGESIGCVTNHIHGPHGQISTRDDSMEVCQWKAVAHCNT